MSERKWPLLSLAGSSALAGLAVVFAQSLPYAAFLIGVAVALVIGTVVWSAWESIPRILTNPEQAKEAARSIYRHAAKTGGTIHATHIFPLNVHPKDDFAIQELGQAGSEIDIVFHRILLLDSISDERDWLTLLFGRLGENVVKYFYTLSSYPLLLPRIAKAVLPRLNLILYQSNKRRSYRVLVGLDRLHLAGVSVNFALQSRSKRVHTALLRYFDQITGSPHFHSCTSLEEYDASQPASTAVQRGQAVVSKVVDFAETTRGVVFVGLFGSIARAALGLADPSASEDTDADVDLLMVLDPRSYAGTVQELQTNVQSALDERRANVTWGPDVSVFYPFRDKHRIDVDIECIAVGSEFYSDNQLLGNSIFRYFMPLYSADQRGLLSYVQVPMAPLAAQERWRLIISDRQGLEYFSERLSQPLLDTDPRRLVSHVYRNLVWAITGTWPATGREARRFLMGSAPWNREHALRETDAILAKSAQDVRASLESAFCAIRTMIECVLSHASEAKNAS